MRKAVSLYQFQGTDMEKVFDLMESLARWGGEACELAVGSLGLCSPSRPEVTRLCPAAHAIPATTLIINISNSTLVDCAIGNGHGLPAVVEKQPLLAGSIREDSRCRCKHGHTVAAQPSLPSPPATIHVHSSNLNYVIIGDSNYMQVVQTTSS